MGSSRAGAGRREERAARPLMVGTAVPRREDERMLAGHGRYLADMAVGARAVVFARSSVAHALIDSIDVKAAAALPGVLGIFTGDDLRLVRNYINPLHT